MVGTYQDQKNMFAHIKTDIFIDQYFTEVEADPTMTISIIILCASYDSHISTVFPQIAFS